MRILYLNHNLRGHGTWFRAFDVAREMARRGHESILWTAAPHHWYRSAEETVDGVRVVETPSWSPLIDPDDGWGPLDAAWRWARVLSEKFDLVYAFAHPPNVYLPARAAQVLRGKPLVVDWCDIYRDGIFPVREEIAAYQNRNRGFRFGVERLAARIECRLERRIVRKAAGVTAISREIERLARAEGVDSDRVLHLPPGANLDAIRPMDQVACRRDLGIEGEGPFLGYVANYNPDERMFLEALARVFERHPSARLIARCPEFNSSLVERQGVGERLIMLDRVPYSRLQVVLGAADVLVLPLEDNASNRARWPNKFCDYLASGRPVVAGGVGDIAAYFPPSEGPGAIGDVSSPSAGGFAEAIVRVLDRPESWEEMGRAARRLAEERFQWSERAETLEKFLVRIASNRRAL
ncbi:glycosyltransferase family 4 protein [Candidatus Sumerlaeota bacterium]|nr:glycosyltransferase family 4 protein [Candidatus Sumerlaeota bacterium]